LTEDRAHAFGVRANPVDGLIFIEGEVAVPAMLA
jgi:hypothetical protein